MKNRILFLILLLALAQTRAAAPFDSSTVLLTATTQPSPPRITLQWGSGNGLATGYKVYRRAPGGVTWGNPIATLSGLATSYGDSGAGLGSSYEYRVERTQSAGPPALGYIFAGVAVAFPHTRGRVILIVESGFGSAPGMEMATLINDLVGDGWTVLRRDVGRGPDITDPEYAQKNYKLIHTVKGIIAADYRADPANTKAVFLLGRIAVPYSASASWDNHADHFGAWPADAYYGELTSPEDPTGWSDVAVDTTVAARSENWNRPLDSKFDQNGIPSAMELQVGRVDLSRMPAFGLSEDALLRRYINKSHAYRYRATVPPLRGFIYNNPNDQLAWFDDVRRAGWRNLEAMVPDASLSTGAAYWDTLRNGSWSWAIAPGFGSFFGINSIGTTADLAARCQDPANEPKVTFTTMFGSYFGDWDIQDNFLRAQICAPNHTLAATWNDRAQSFSMGLGETIGYAVRSTQNWKFTEGDASPWGPVYYALMGDPTLRMHAVAPPTNFHASGTSLLWNIVPQPGLQGYYVYRGTTPNGPFTLLATLGVVTSYNLGATPSGTYMIRARKQETTPSGTFTNASQGVLLVTGGAVAPTIVNMPMAQSVRRGQAACFTVHAVGCNAQGQTDLSYVWLKNGNVLANDGRIDGVSSAALIINDVQDSDAGNYTVRVSNAPGTLVSTPAALTIDVRQPPHGVADNLTIDEGTRADFNLLANDTDPNQPPLGLSWLSLGYPPPVGDAHFDLGETVTLVAGQPGVVRYTPEAWLHGTSKSFVYVISNLIAAVGVPVTITIRDTATAHDLNLAGLAGSNIGPGTSGSSRVLANGNWELSGTPGYRVVDGVTTFRPEYAHYESQLVTGDFEVKVRIQEITGLSQPTGGGGGLMLRESAGECSRCVTVGMSYEQTVTAGYSLANDCSNTFLDQELSSPVLTRPNAWVGLRRRGDRVSLFASADGVTWQSLGKPFTLPGLPIPVSIGLYAGRRASPTRVVFSGYQRQSFSGSGSYFHGDLRFTGWSAGGNGTNFTMQLAGGPSSGRGELQGSDDLLSWYPLTNFQANGGAVQLTDSRWLLFNHFYRAHVEDVESVNALGFAKVGIFGGQNLLANPFDNRQGNQIHDVLPVALEGATVSKWNDALQQFDPAITRAGGQWSQPNTVLAPGTGFFFNHPQGAPASFYYSGEVPQGLLHNPLVDGESLRGSIVPQALTLEALGLPIVDGLGVQFWNPNTQAFDEPFNYFDGFGWFPVEPRAPGIGEGFFINALSALDWTRHYSSWPHPRLGSVTRLPNGHCQFQISGGSAHGTVEVQASSDLKNWQAVGTRRVDAVAVGFDDAGAVGQPHRFYRAAAGPDRSVNAVGFSEVQGVAGHNLLGRQLHNETGSSLNALLPSVPSGSVVRRWNDDLQTYDAPSTFTAGAGWSIDYALRVGDGFFVELPSAYAFTFTGEVPQGPLNRSLAAGNSFRCPPVPQAGYLIQLDFPAEDGDAVYVWNSQAQNFGAAAVFIEGFGWFGDFEVRVGDGLVVQTALPKNWPRRFSVWPELALNAPVMRANGDFQFQIGGGATVGSATIESSVDLSHWTALATVSLDGYPRTFVDPQVRDLGFRCYRVSVGTQRSLNAVGFRPVTFAPGNKNAFTPLFLCPDGNSYAGIFPGLITYAEVNKWNDATQMFESGGIPDPGIGWFPDGTLEPGMAAFFLLGESFSTTVVGEVPQGDYTITVPAGAAFVAGLAPGSGPVSTGLGFPISAGDRVARWNGDGYDTYTYSAGGWTLNAQPVPEPVLSVGEPFLSIKAAPAIWSRQFTLWP